MLGKRCNICVIGVGPFARLFIRCYQRHPCVGTVSVFSRDPQWLLERAKPLGIAPEHCYASFEIVPMPAYPSMCWPVSWRSPSSVSVPTMWAGSGGRYGCKDAYQTRLVTLKSSDIKGEIHRIIRAPLARPGTLRMWILGNMPCGRHLCGRFCQRERSQGFYLRFFQSLKHSIQHNRYNWLIHLF